jgi:hypothetical protein
MIYSALLAAAVLVVSSGVATAKSRHYSRSYNSAVTTTGQGGALRTPMRGRSSTNPEAASGGRGGWSQPHMVPENGGAPNAVVR